MKFLDLASLKIVTRSRWTEIPIPAEVIEYINSLSEGEGKARLPKNPNFEVGGRIINDIEGNDHRANETDELPGNNLEGRVIDRNLAYQQGDVPVNEIVARYDAEDSESDDEEDESVTGESIGEDNETVVEEQVNVPENNCEVNVKTDEAEEDLENQEMRAITLCGVATERHQVTIRC